jgi:OmpA-OmpF porin, OOP family
MKKLLFSAFIMCAFACEVSAQGSMVVPNNEEVPKTLDYKVVNNEVRTETHVSFGKGTAEILPASVQELETIKKYLEDKSYISLLRVEGHTSCGNGAQELSEARAIAIVEWLVAHGVDCKRLLPVGFGCTKPITDTHNEVNARITFVNAELKGRAIGGMPVDGGGKVAGDACQ